MKRDEFVELLVNKVTSAVKENRDLTVDDVNNLSDELAYEDVVTDIVGDVDEPEPDEDPDVTEPDTDR
jgi:hypothetical protein